MKAAITFDSLNKRDKMRVIEAAKKVYLETQEAQIIFTRKFGEIVPLKKMSLEHLQMRRMKKQ